RSLQRTRGKPMSFRTSVKLFGKNRNNDGHFCICDLQAGLECNEACKELAFDLEREFSKLDSCHIASRGENGAQVTRSQAASSGKHTDVASCRPLKRAKRCPKLFSQCPARQTSPERGWSKWLIARSLPATALRLHGLKSAWSHGRRLLPISSATCVQSSAGNSADTFQSTASLTTLEVFT